MFKNKLYICILLVGLTVFFNSCKKDTLLLEENFDTNSNHWDTFESKLMYSRIENGKWVMSNKMDNVTNLSLIYSDLLTKNICITVSVKADRFYGEKGAAGLILFADNQKFPENYIFFGVNAENELVLSYESKNPALAQTFYKQKNNACKIHQFNEFSAVTDKTSIQFLINEKPFIAIKKPENLGNFYGFIVLNSQITADDLRVKLSK